MNLIIKYSIINILIGISIFILSPTVYASIEIHDQHTQRFISVSDIHFDPFASCKVLTLGACPLVKKLRQAPAQEWQNLFEQYDSKTLATYGQDTNYALLKTTLAELKRAYQNEHPQFVLILGDFLGHDYRAEYILYSRDPTKSGYQNFVKKTLQFLTSEIRQVIPEGDIYPIVGNNDSYTGDYGVVPKGEFFHDVSNIWATLIKDKSNQASFTRDFPQGGYYVVQSPTNKNQRIIVLNTVLFSTSIQGPHIRQAATDELSWLHKQLVAAAKNHQVVILAFHIPVGINVYATLKNLWSGIKEFWQQRYTNVFQADLAEFAGTITAILPGHIHMDSFQVVGFKKPQKMPVSFTPSISPIYGNNPGFKIYSYDALTFQLKNFKTYYYPLNSKEAIPSWQEEYNFNQVYQGAQHEDNLTHGMDGLTPEGNLVSSYKKYYSVGHYAQPITEDHNWLPYYWCNIHTISRSDYQTCLRQK